MWRLHDLPVSMWVFSGLIVSSKLTESRDLELRNKRRLKIDGWMDTQEEYKRVQSTALPLSFVMVGLTHVLEWIGEGLLNHALFTVKTV